MYNDDIILLPNIPLVYIYFFLLSYLLKFCIVCLIRNFKPSLIYVKCFSIKIKTTSMSKPFELH